MENNLTLRQYEYSIPVLPLAQPATGKKVNNRPEKHSSLIKVTIDFEFGNLLIEGEWQSLIAGNGNNDLSCYNSFKENVFLRASLQPAFPVSLDCNANDGLALTVEGQIEDKDQLSDCTGLLVLEKNVTDLHWTIKMYLYEIESPNWEIKMTIPLYVNF